VRYRELILLGYQQSDRCFFCGELLKEEDASIEHLHPKSRGGTSLSTSVIFKPIPRKSSKCL
jgi:hypothetical protein